MVGSHCYIVWPNRQKIDPEPADHELSEPVNGGAARRFRRQRFGGQAIKGIRRMPRRQEAMKDVVSCEKPRGAETSVDPWISEWGNPR